MVHRVVVPTSSPNAARSKRHLDDRRYAKGKCSAHKSCSALTANGINVVEAAEEPKPRAEGFTCSSRSECSSAAAAAAAEAAEKAAAADAPERALSPSAMARLKAKLREKERREEEAEGALLCR